MALVIIYQPLKSGNSVGSGILIHGHSDGAISATAVADNYAVSGSSISYTGPGSSSFYETSSTELTSMLSSLTFSAGAGALSINLFKPATASLTHTSNEIGRAYIQSGARSGNMVTRGGSFNVSNSPGLFAADFDTPITGQSSVASFRCAKPL